LIEDLLDDERRKDPELEHYFAEVQLEPVFVKNLESVQGDERDVMYFSITYGPDMAGAVSMNFGPLNRDGGERRLNVAVTRARHELRVFSSLRGEQMDLSRTKAAGVRDLKHFLEFAERGQRSLAEAHHGSLGDFESPFEVSVAQALGRKGWQVHTQIGASSFRVDLGVVHPDFAGRYLAGVECDGATYHRSATARDRDKLREQVLRGLGWEILRVWSTDWWVNPGGTLDRVHQRLVELLEADRAKQPQAPDTADAAMANDYTAGGSADPNGADAEASAAIARAARGSIAGGEAQTGVRAADHEQAYAPASEAGERVSGEKASHAERDVFRVAEPAEAVPPGALDANRFFENGYDTVLQPMVEWVIEREGPILDAVLARRIARAHGFQRTGGRIQERVEALARRRFRMTEEAGGTFYWPDGLPPSTYVAFRRAASEDSNRGVEEVCEAELTSLARAVLSRGFGGQDALISMARELGLQRLREASKGRLEDALRRAQATGTN
jgi:very-short-patch-repair endonuclease